MLAKLKRYPKEGALVFLDPAGYKEYVADAQQTFEQHCKSNRRPHIEHD
jgi:hypothetical protein